MWGEKGVQDKEEGGDEEEELPVSRMGRMGRLARGLYEKTSLERNDRISGFYSQCWVQTYSRWLRHYTSN